MNKEFLNALEAVSKDKGIDKEFLIEAIETALLSAYKREFNQVGEVRGIVNRKTGEMGVYAVKKVVTKVEDPDMEVSVEEALKVNKHYQEGDEIEVNVMPKTFGRIAAQTAKQVIVQRIREAEREIACNEFSEKKGEILLGLVQRIEQGPRNNIMIEIGTQEAILTQSEQVPSENIRPGEKIYLYVMVVKDYTRGLQIVLSRRRCI